MTSTSTPPSFRRVLHTATMIALMIAALSRGLAAQSHAVAGSYFESYSFNDPVAAGFKRVSLLTVPFAVAVQPARWARLGVSSTFASATVERNDGTQSTVSGLTDTALELSLPIVQDRLIVAASLMLPFGKSTFSPEEAQVAGIVAADLLPFRLTHWGSGGALDVSTQATGTVGALNVGARLGYQKAREFELLRGGLFLYRPGSQVYGRVAADGEVGTGRLAAQLTVYTFGDDQRNSRNLYRTGNRVQGMLTYSLPAGSAGRVQAYVGAMRREHGTFADGSSETPAQTMLLFGGGVRQLLRGVVLIPLMDVRLVSSSDGLGQGYIGDIGVTAEIPTLGGATLLPTLRVRRGQLKVRAGATSAITGFELGAGLRFGGAGGGAR